MQNKTISIIIILIVLLLGGYFLLSKPKAVVAPPIEQNTSTQKTLAEEAPVVNKAPKKYEIAFTAGGFAPAVLSIVVGDTVAFVNKSSESFWPASNDHPTHTAYPEFDAKAEIAAGKTYEFVFMNPGAWGYHNHLDSKMMGVVVVKSL
jgi:plastocyanin